MRIYPSVCVFLLVAGLIVFASADSDPNPEGCVSNTPVCGQFKLSKRCQKFKNICQLEAANSNNRASNLATPFVVINDKFCVDIPLDTRGWCKGMGSRRRPGFPSNGNPNGGSNGFDATFN